MLSPDQASLLNATIQDLLHQIKEPENSELKHVRQSAFDMYLPEKGETVQVHVTITRDENDFLDFLETECMS